MGSLVLRTRGEFRTSVLKGSLASLEGSLTLCAQGEMDFAKGSLASLVESCIQNIFHLGENCIEKSCIFAPSKTGYSVVRLSRLLWEQEVACSNQAIPTRRFRSSTG